MSDDARADGVWGPSGGLVGLAWVAAAAAAAWCVLLVATGADPPGLLLASTATLGLGLAALYGTRARPRLRVDASGLVVRGLVGSRHHPWVRVDDVRVLAVRRLGRESTLLEIDVTEPNGRERMMIFGRLELDDDPADVAEAIHAIRPGR